MNQRPFQLQRARHRHPHGLTLVEMILALAITGLVGAAIAAMLGAVAYGTADSHDLREAVVKSKTMSTRMGAAVRRARQVLDHGDSYIVLWIRDADDNQLPSLHEIQRLEHDVDDTALVSYEAAEDAPDTVYALDDDFGAITQTLKDLNLLTAEVWGRDVINWSLTLDDENAPQAAELASFRLTFQLGDLEETAIGAAALRN